MLRKRQVNLYLRRLGLENMDLKPNAESLRVLQHRHLLQIPFENLDIQRGNAIELDVERFYEKIVVRGRGGFCYELNGLFASLLRALGFPVVRLSARVRNDKRRDGYNPEYDHLVLLVRLGRNYLADVGFGDNFLEPLDLDSASVQTDSAGRFRMRTVEGGYRLLQREKKGTWKDVYRFSLRPRRLGEFARMCRYHQTSPESHFTSGPVCTIARPTGRITLTGNKLIRTLDGKQEESPVHSPEEFRELLDRHFGILLNPPAK